MKHETSPLECAYGKMPKYGVPLMADLGTSETDDTIQIRRRLEGHRANGLMWCAFHPTTALHYK